LKREQNRKEIVKKLHLTLLILTVFVIASGCYYYEPAPPPVVYPPEPSYPSYDYTWDSAIRAAQDVGIEITSLNRNTGTIFGRRDRVDVTIQVTQQANGRTRVELTAQGSRESGADVADDFYWAYDHYMGRR